MKFLKNSKGFTLVEMLIVMAVVAVLATAVLPKVSDITAGAREANTLAALSAAYTNAYAKKMADSTYDCIVDGVDVQTTTFSYLSSPKIGGMEINSTNLTGTANTSGRSWVKFTFGTGAEGEGITLTKIEVSAAKPS